jgi:hypothetical protein
MANDTVKRGPQNVSENTQERPLSLPVSTHVGQNTVQIDASALRHLIDTVRARLSSERKPN